VNDGGVAEQPSRQQHVEVAEVTHEYGVRFGEATRATRQGQPGARKFHGEQREAPRLPEHPDPVSGVEAERDVALVHLDALFAQTVH